MARRRRAGGRRGRPALAVEDHITAVARVFVDAEPVVGPVRERRRLRVVGPAREMRVVRAAEPDQRAAGAALRPEHRTLVAADSLGVRLLEDEVADDGAGCDRALRVVRVARGPLGDGEGDPRRPAGRVRRLRDDVEAGATGADRRRRRPGEVGTPGGEQPAADDRIGRLGRPRGQGAPPPPPKTPNRRAVAAPAVASTLARPAPTVMHRVSRCTRRRESGRPPHLRARNY